MKTILGALVGVTLGICVSHAIASRNSSGTMAALNGPYVPGTTISSTIVNARLADIESEITDSASRSGKGGFTAPVRGPNGTVAAPAFSFTSNTGTGPYLIAANDLGMSINGVKTQEWTTTGSSITGTFAGSGTGSFGDSLTVNGAAAETSAGILTTLDPSGAKLLWAMGSTGAKTRFYLDSQKSLLITVNAAFNGTNWVADTNGTCVKYKFNATAAGLTSLSVACVTATPFADGTFTTIGAGFGAAASVTAPTPDTNVTAGNGLGYWKDSSGIVHFRGKLTNATGGNITNLITTAPIPAGFRPLSTRIFGCPGDVTTVYALAVGSGGTVALDTTLTNGLAVYLDCISYLAEQ